MRFLMMFTVMLGACAGDGNQDTACTKALYDPCVTEHDCTTMSCLTFPTFEACSQGCDATNPCPKQAGKDVPCTNSVCTPVATNVCVIGSN